MTDRRPRIDDICPGALVDTTPWVFFRPLNYVELDEIERRRRDTQTFPNLPPEPKR